MKFVNETVAKHCFGARALAKRALGQILLCATFAACIGQPLVAQPLGDRPSVTIRGQTIYLRLAISPNEWQRGLMYEKKLADHEGMLFIGQRAELRSFWMKNTLISLDMIFIRVELDAQKKPRWIVDSLIENAEPLTESPQRSKNPVHHVLEIRGGLAKHWKIRAGDLITPNDSLKRRIQSDGP